MVKERLYIRLEPEIKEKLLQKAKDFGFTGRGSIIRYIEKVATSEVLFIDANNSIIFKLIGEGLRNGK